MTAAIISLTVYLSYRFAEKVLGFLGHAGTDVVLRLSAFILLCLGVQIVWRGLAVMAGQP